MEINGTQITETNADINWLSDERIHLIIAVAFVDVLSGQYGAETALDCAREALVRLHREAYLQRTREKK